MPIALPTMSFSFEEWSSTNHLIDDSDDTNKGTAAHFVGSNDNDDDDMLYDKFEDDPSTLRRVCSYQSQNIGKRSHLMRYHTSRST